MRCRLCRTLFSQYCDAQGATCRVSQCQSDHDCARGAKCNVANGACAPIAYFCPDPFTIEGSDGQKMSCSPYQCIAGSCKPFCTYSADYAQGYSCSGGRCVK